MNSKLFSITDIAIIGVFSALAVTAGYLLAPIPNIELFTATIFLSGVLFGRKHGCLVGMLAGCIFGIYNPWGPSPGPLLLVQVLVRGVVGFVGGLFGDFNWPGQPFWLRGLAFGVAGFLLTSLYNIAVALSFVIPAGFTTERLAAEFVTGFLLISIGTLSNVVIFALVIPVAANGLKRSTRINILNKSV